MPEQVSIDIDKVGFDTDVNGIDACCATSLSKLEATPNGIGVICDVCGDGWVSQTKSDGSVVWLRTYAGKYSPAVREGIVKAADKEKKIKRNMVLSLSVLALIVIIWNIIDYVGNQYALAYILFTSSVIILICGAASAALFGNLFRRFSRNAKKLRYEIK